MTRLIFLAVLIWVLWLLLRQITQALRAAAGPPSAAASAAGGHRVTAKRGERLLPCGVCETCVPASRALKTEPRGASSVPPGEAYCSPACLEIALRRSA